jgi:hypothetical protein
MFAVIAGTVLAIGTSAFIPSRINKSTPFGNRDKAHKFATATYQYNLDVTDQINEDNPANYSKVTGSGPTCIGSTAICTIVAPVPSPDNGQPDFSTVNPSNPVRTNPHITGLTFKP